MERPEQIPQPRGEGDPEEKKMVGAIKISTVFPDRKVLEKIADNLLTKGFISGFHIDRTLSGYIHKGKKVEEDQYSLEILIDDQTDERIKAEIRVAIETAIVGEKWEIPVIEEERVQVNKELFGFIRGAEVEHQKYIKEKRLKLTIALSALLSISAMIGTFTEKYFDVRQQKAVAAERVKSYKKMRELEQKISQQIFALDAQIAAGKPLTVTPNDMSAATDYKDTQEVLATVREAESVMRELSEDKK